MSEIHFKCKKYLAGPRWRSPPPSAPHLGLGGHVPPRAPPPHATPLVMLNNLEARPSKCKIYSLNTNMTVSPHVKVYNVKFKKFIKLFTKCKISTTIKLMIYCK